VTVRVPRTVRIGLACLALGVPLSAHAQDAASIVARARAKVEEGAYADALRILDGLATKILPPQLAIESALLQATASLVTSGPEAAARACRRAVLASGFDPEVAREQSPKLREACRTAAREVRSTRLREEHVTVGALVAPAPSVAYQPVRVSAELAGPPAWLRLAARVTTEGLGATEGAIDIPLLPSQDGLARGTLDADWIRPGCTLTVALVAQDRYGDLGAPLGTVSFSVPRAEAGIALGKIPEGATVRLDDAAATADASGFVSATPGEHRVGLRLANGAFAETEITIARGEVAQVALAPELAGASYVWPAITTGAAISLLGAGTAFLLTSNARRIELEERAATREPGTNLPAYDYAELVGIDEERVTFERLGVGLLVGGGVASIAATTLWIVGTGGDAAPESAAAQLDLGPGWIGVRGTF
jgi:hypothetical protein